MSGYQTYRPHYSSYRDESRDPRIRRADIDRKYSERDNERSYTPAASVTRETSQRPSKDVHVNERRSPLRVLQDEQYSRKIKRGSPTRTSIKQIPAKQPTPEKTSISRKLIVGDDISDPFTCNLTDDDGKRCIRDFSGVRRYPEGADKIGLSRRGLATSR